MQMWTDASAESRPSESELIYVPRDEEYEDIKQQYIKEGKLKAVLRIIVPALRYKIMGSELISNIDRFIQEPTEHSVPKSLLNFLKFDPPKLFSSK
jgi:lipoxygenase